MGGDSAGRQGFVLIVLLNLRFRYGPTGSRPASVNLCMFANRHFEGAACDPKRLLPNADAALRSPRSTPSAPGLPSGI